jgi:hypothetical protein
MKRGGTKIYKNGDAQSGSRVGRARSGNGPVLTKRNEALVSSLSAEPNFFVVALCFVLILCAPCFVLMLCAYQVFWSPPGMH